MTTSRLNAPLVVALLMGGALGALLMWQSAPDTGPAPGTTATTAPERPSPPPTLPPPPSALTADPSVPSQRVSSSAPGSNLDREALKSSLQPVKPQQSERAARRFARPNLTDRVPPEKDPSGRPPLELPSDLRNIATLPPLGAETLRRPTEVNLNALADDQPKEAQ